MNQFIKLPDRNTEDISLFNRIANPANFVLVAVVIISFSIKAYPSGSEFCVDLKYLIEQSKNQFSMIQQEADKQENNESQFFLTDAESCKFSLGINSNSYQCFWKYDFGSERAITQLEFLRMETKKCIGHLYVEQLDDSVNHPDFYLAYYYVMLEGQVNIALKDKSVTMNTYVSVRVDAQK